MLIPGYWDGDYLVMLGVKCSTYIPEYWDGDDLTCVSYRNTGMGMLGGNN